MMRKLIVKNRIRRGGSGLAMKMLSYRGTLEVKRFIKMDQLFFVVVVVVVVVTFDCLEYHW